MFDALFARSGLSHDRLRSLCEVAEAGGIARAVGNDTTRQSLVSRQLKELEEFFECELTRREGKTLALTAAGLDLARLSREHLAALDDFAATARGADLRFSLGAGDSVLHWKVVPRLAAARRSLPDVALVLHALGPAAVVERLGDLRIDFGIVRGATEHRALSSSRLGRVEYALYVPRRLLTTATRLDARTKVEVRLKLDARALLPAVPLALPHGDDVFNRWLAALSLGEEVAPNLALACETFPQACSAVLTGEYAAILPTFARGELRGRAIAEVRSDLFQELGADMFLLWNPRVLRLRTAAERARQALLRSVAWD